MTGIMPQEIGDVDDDDQREEEESSWYNNNSNYWKAMMGRISICVGVLF